MKISNKKLTLALVFALILPCMFLMSACGKKGPKAPTITSLSAELNPYYTANAENLGWENKDLKVTYSDGKTETVKLKNDMIGACNLVETGKKEVVITYKGKTISKTIYVADKIFKNQIFNAKEGKAQADLTFEDDKAYIYDGCTFNGYILTYAKGLNLLFDGCVFNAAEVGSAGGKCIYIPSFVNLEVINSTFSGETSTGTESSAGYGIDLNIFNTNAKNVVIKNNVFKIKGTKNNGVAISIKVRGGETDCPAKEADGAAKTAGTLENVLIEGNTFTADNNRIYIGTNPKKEPYTNPNISTGKFNVELKNNDADVNVYERYLLNKEQDSQKDSHKILVEKGKTQKFGNKTI